MRHGDVVLAYVSEQDAQLELTQLEQRESWRDTVAQAELDRLIEAYRELLVPRALTEPLDAFLDTLEEWVIGRSRNHEEPADASAG